MASAALAILLISTINGSTPTAAQTTPVKPNFVFILTDDMRQDDLKYMPKTRGLLGDQGMQFTNAFVSNPLCCPSRATIMRGQYAHNTGVWTNTPGPDGAWQGYKNHGNEQDNIGSSASTLTITMEARCRRAGTTGSVYPLEPGSSTIT
jgi:N-acetylglucosamine-6-sulfatase